MIIRYILRTVSFFIILLFAVSCRLFPISQQELQKPSIVNSDLPVEVLWTSGVNKQVVSPPVIGKSVSVVKTRGELLAYDIRNGRIRWQRYLNIGNSSPVLADVVSDIFFVGDGQNTVWALDGLTGKVVWKYVFPDDTTDISDIVINNGILYAATAPKIYVAAIDASSGTEIWRRENDLGYRGTHLFLNGDELIVVPLEAIRVLNRFTGETIRTKEVYIDGVLVNLPRNDS